MMKKTLTILLIIALAMVLMAGCTGKTNTDTKEKPVKTAVPTTIPTVKHTPVPTKTCDDKEIKSMVRAWVDAKFAKVANYGKIGQYHSALKEANKGMNEIRDMQRKFKQLTPCKYTKSYQYHSEALDKYVKAMELTVKGTEQADNSEGARGSELIIQGNDLVKEAQRLQTRADDYLN